MHCGRLSVFFLLLISVSCFSQKRHAINLTTNDGLPITSVRAFHKDSRGYLWIGTDAGVVKYDGLEMSVFNSYNGLPGEKVWDIAEDWNGEMWFACFGEGIAKYDGKKFTSYTIEDWMPDKAIRKIACHHPTKTLILATGKACATISEDFEIQSTEGFFTPDSSNTYTEILMNDSVALVLAHKYRKHMSIDLKTKTITPYSSNWMKKYYISAGLVTYNNDTVVSNKRDGIVIKTDSSLTEIGGMGQVFGITEDGQRRLWLAAWNDSKAVGDDGGLFCYNGGEVKSGNKTFNIETTFGWAIFNDSLQSETWFGTLDKGIYMFPLPYFTLYDNMYFDESNFSVEQIVCRNGNEVVAISKNTLIRILPDKKYEKLTIAELVDLQIACSETHQNIISKNHRSILIAHKSDPDYFTFKSIAKATNNDIMVGLRNLNTIVISNDLNAITISYLAHAKFTLDENDTITSCDSWSHEIEKYGHYKNIQKRKAYRIPRKSIMAKKLYSYQNET
ncbi:MAG: two-component regulator propeller domain-containing protein, partial [Bacteroidales bacterium]|nr:two-component regulator propeller domain-containing protein [Bacteroidales bacterium]